MDRHFTILIEGASYGLHEGVSRHNDAFDISYELTDTQERVDKDGTRTVQKIFVGTGSFKNEGIVLEVCETVKYFPGNIFTGSGKHAGEMSISVKNIGKIDAVLTHVSSFRFDELDCQNGGFYSSFGRTSDEDDIFNKKHKKVRNWWDRNRMTIHTSDSVWQGEGQWREETFHDVGLFPTSTHGNMKTYQIGSIGNWTTARKYPQLILEDKDLVRSIFVRPKPLGTWQITLFNEVPGFEYMSSGSVGIEVNCADQMNGAWEKTLKPGESYDACPVVFGYVDGDWQKAAGALIEVARATRKASWKTAKLTGGKIPVVYNTYMNGVWADQNARNLVPLIEATSKAGVEVFVIDDGWFTKRFDTAWPAGLMGDYEINETIFGEYKLAGIIDLIKKHGMIPGIWIELECVMDGTNLAKLELPDGDSPVLKRNGRQIGGLRCLANLASKEVRARLMSVVDRLYKMGIRYIKNDFNQTAGAGADVPGIKSRGEASEVLAHAFLDFIGEIRTKFPDLIIENCGSGALRSDMRTLSQFEVQGMSDQELFYRNASVLSGSLGLIEPEKCGAWSYPIPVLFNEMDKIDSPKFRAKLAKRTADTVETRFNMVNGLLSSILLSGRIDWADENNFTVIKNMIDAFKTEVRPQLGDMLPVWPTGTFKLDDVGVQTMALVNAKERCILLAVWNISKRQASIGRKISAVGLELDLGALLCGEPEWTRAKWHKTEKFEYKSLSCDKFAGKLSKNEKRVNVPGYFSRLVKIRY